MDAIALRLNPEIATVLRTCFSTDWISTNYPATLLKHLEDAGQSRPLEQLVHLIKSAWLDV
jgi:hypothetical protein